MHEWSLAEAVVSAVSQIAEKEGLKEVRKVQLRLGELQQVDKKILKFALSQMKSGKLGKTKFTIRTIKAEFMCRKCNHKWFLREVDIADEIRESIHFIPEVAYAYLRCPKCGSPDFEILKGRGLWIAEIKGVK